MDWIIALSWWSFYGYVPEVPRRRSRPSTRAVGQNGFRILFNSFGDGVPHGDVQGYGQVRVRHCWLRGCPPPCRWSRPAEECPNDDTDQSEPPRHGNHGADEAALYFQSSST